MMDATAQTEDIVDAEIVPRRNLPAVRDEPGELAVLDPPSLLLRWFDVADLGNADWPEPWSGRWKWAHALPLAIRDVSDDPDRRTESDPVTFRALIVAGLAHGFDGVKVSPGEFEVALLEFDVRLAGAR